jgi:predicted CopG family antitoxin
MGKINKSITINSEIFEKGKNQAKHERRSFSSFIEYLIDAYTTKINQSKNNKK